MKPVNGMHIICVSRGEISTVRWLAEYNNDDTYYLDTYNNTFSKNPRVYELDCWAPLNFFDEHFPKGSENDRGSLNPDDNWFIKHKDNPLTDELKTKTDEYNALNKFEFNHYQQIENLFHDIDFPGERQAQKEAEQEMWKSLGETLKAMENIPVPKFVEEMAKISKKAKSTLGNHTIRMKRYGPEPKYYINKETNEKIAEYTNIRVCDKDKWSQE